MSAEGLLWDNNARENLPWHQSRDYHGNVGEVRKVQEEPMWISDGHNRRKMGLGRTQRQRWGEGHGGALGTLGSCVTDRTADFEMTTVC